MNASSSSTDSDVSALLFALEMKLRRDRHAELVCFGTSMMPLVWPGTLVRLEPAAPEALRPGDLVLYGRRGQVVLHRVVGRQGASLLVRGDALEVVDRVPTAAILGRARGAVLFRWQLGPDSPLGAAVGTVAPAAGWLYRRRRNLGPLARVGGAAFRLLR